MILADSSAWIEYDRATGSAVHHRVRALIATDAELAVTEPVIMEVLSGARTDRREAELRELLERHQLLPLDAGGDFDLAVGIYRRCRGAGITPRGTRDCLIAAVAWRRGATLLSYDADMARIAAVIGLDLDDASLSS